MKKIVLLLFINLFIGCDARNKEKVSQEQINQLNLDKSEILLVHKAHIEAIAFNNYLKEQSFYLTDKIDKIKLIPLATNTNSLLASIYKVICTDSNIYVHDNYKGGGIVIFDIYGKFIRRIPNGSGPGELRRLHDICYDDKSQRLVAYQHPFLTFYSSDGKFINHQKLPFGFYNFIRDGDNYIFKTLDGLGNEHLQDKQNNTLLITNKDFQLNKVSLPFAPKKMNLSGFHYLGENNEGIYITHAYIDTIYFLDSEYKKIEAKYLLNYKNKKMPDSFLDLNFANARKKLEETDCYYYTGDYFETLNHQVIFLKNNFKGLTTVIYRDKSSGNMIGGTSLNYNENELLPYGFPVISTKNSFLSVYWPNGLEKNIQKGNLISDSDKIKLANINDGDNPIIILFNLKHF